MSNAGRDGANSKELLETDTGEYRYCCEWKRNGTNNLIYEPESLLGQNFGEDAKVSKE
jgi:hypothetical protein